MDENVAKIYQQLIELGPGFPILLFGCVVILSIIVRIINNISVFKACMNNNTYSNYIVYLFLLPIFIGFTIGSFITKNKLMFSISSALFMVIFIITWYNYYNCQDNNSNIIRVVDRSGISPGYNLMRDTSNIYRKVMSTLKPLSSCDNILNKIQARENPTDMIGYVCNPIETISTCTYEDPLRLIDVQIAASYCTPSVGGINSGFGSSKMISHVINAGARYLHFPVTTSVIDNHIMPVINFKYNYVTFSSCLHELNQAINIQPIAPYKFKNFPSDPIFIHIEIDVKHDISVMNRIARSLVSMFSDRLLGKEYNYNDVNIINEPYNMCSFFEKIIILASGDNTKGTLLDELINISIDKVGSNYVKYYDWNDAESLSESSKLKDDAYKYLTIIKGHTVNKDPTSLINAGCHIVPMNYSPIDVFQATYLGYFKTSSFLYRRQNAT